MLRAVIVLLSFACAAPAWAKGPSAQGKACSASDKCDAKLSCLRGGDGKSTCQLVCNEKTKCPEDQRCVKDAGHSVCRPINDGLTPDVPTDGTSPKF
jgi:hypothetical protein